MEYSEFLDKKLQEGTNEGFNPTYINKSLMDFQVMLTDWAIRKGKGALFCDCGLGKTPMQLVWAQNVVEHTNKPVLILTPLAVAPQTMREGVKFDIPVYKATETKAAKIMVSNYEKLHYFDCNDFGGVVCDESSILKNFDGTRKAQITEFMRRVPYRLLCTATAAPNDYIELGTSSEALGNLGYTDMLTRYFVNDQHTIKPQTYLHRGSKISDIYESNRWRFKGHAEQSFWRWVCSWSRAIRKPSDLGFEDGQFQLPPLVESETIIKANTVRPGMLFEVDSIGLSEEREVRRRTLSQRCESAASYASQHKGSIVIWCHLNDEADMLEKLIPDALQISGSQSDEIKEERFESFRNGELRVLVIKPKIGAFGLNWQHCNQVVYFASHSYEQYYQAVRRCWRFGQTNQVNVNIIMADGEQRIVKNLRRKAVAADKMFSNLVLEMNHAISLQNKDRFIQKVEVPSWLQIHS